VQRNLHRAAAATDGEIHVVTRRNGRESAAAFRGRYRPSIDMGNHVAPLKQSI
jgi:hypothetical protein